VRRKFKFFPLRWTHESRTGTLVCAVFEMEIWQVVFLRSPQIRTARSGVLQKPSTTPGPITGDKSAPNNPQIDLVSNELSVALVFQALQPPAPSLLVSFAPCQVRRKFWKRAMPRAIRKHRLYPQAKEQEITRRGPDVPQASPPPAREQEFSVAGSPSRLRQESAQSNPPPTARSEFPTASPR